MGETVPKYRSDGNLIVHQDEDMTAIQSSLGNVYLSKFFPPKAQRNKEYNMPVDCYASAFRLIAKDELPTLEELDVNFILLSGIFFTKKDYSCAIFAEKREYSFLDYWGTTETSNKLEILADEIAKQIIWEDSSV